MGALLYTLMYKKITNPERPFTLHIFIGCEPKYISRKLNKLEGNQFYYSPENLKLDEDDAIAVFDLGKELPGQFALVIRSEDISVEYIAHEAMHCTARHFRYIGQPLHDSSEESYCYMVGWITGIVYNMVSKK